MAKPSGPERPTRDPQRGQADDDPTHPNQRSDLARELKASGFSPPAPPSRAGKSASAQQSPPRRSKKRSANAGSKGAPVAPPPPSRTGGGAARTPPTKRSKPLAVIPPPPPAPGEKRLADADPKPPPQPPEPPLPPQPTGAATPAPKAKRKSRRRGGKVPPAARRRGGGDRQLGEPTAAERPGPQRSADDELTQTRGPTLPRADILAASRAELALGPGAPRAARLHFEMARCAGAANDALEHYQKALALQPSYLPAIRAARSLLLSKRSIKAALKLFDAELKLVSEPEQRAQLWFERGRALEDVARDHEAARESYQAAVALDARDPALLKAMQQLDAHKELFRELAESRAQEANAVTDPAHRAALLIERARLLETRLGDEATATELYQQALELDSSATGALQALKRLLRLQCRWRELIAVLGREADQASSADVQTLALLRIGEVYSEQLGDHHGAISALARAAQIASTDRLVLEALGRLYEVAGDARNLAHTLAHTVDTMGTSGERLGTLQRIGRIYEQRLDDDDSAQRWYEAALQLDPAYAPAVAALDGLYDRHEQWQALIVMHLAAAEVVGDSTRRAAAHARIAEIFETRVGEREEAMRHYERALSLSPAHEASFKALTRLYASAARHRDLCELYGRAIDRAADDEVVIAYLFKIGEIHDVYLDEAVEAMHAYRRILDIRPDHIGALHAIQRAAESAGRFSELVDALENEAALRREQGRVVALLHRAGEVRARELGDMDTAIARFLRVLEIAPTYAPAVESLGLRYHQLGRFEELLEVYETELDILGDDARRVALLHKMGELCDKQLGDVERGIAYYRRAIAIDPGYGPSLRAVQQRLRERQDYKGLVGVLQSERLGAATAQGRARVSYRLGEVYEVHLEQHERAEQSYAEALDFVEHYRPAAEALRRVRATLGKWTELARDYEHEATRVGDPQLAIEALLRAAEVWEDRLGNPKRAIGSYEAVRSIYSDNLAALLALEPLYRKGCAWEKLAEVYTSQAAVLTEPRAKVAVLRELARLQKSRGLCDEPTRRATYGAILALDAANREALEGLAQIARDTDDSALLADVELRRARAEVDSQLAALHYALAGEALEESSPATALDAYREALKLDRDLLSAIRGMARSAQRCGDVKAMVHAAHHEARWTRADVRAADCRLRAAKLRLERLGDPKGAVADCTQALERCPDHAGAANLLCKLLSESGEAERLVAVLSRAGNGATDAHRIAELWCAVARLYADALGKISSGVATMERLLSEHPTVVAGRHLLGVLYGRQGRHDDAASCFEEVLQIGADPTTTAEAHLALGRLYAAELSDAGKALKHLEALLGIDGEQQEALALLIEIHRKAENFKQAANLARRLAQIAGDVTSRTWSLISLGELLLLQNERREAADTLFHAVTYEGPSGQGAALYKKLLGDEEPWSRYVAALQEHLSRINCGEVAVTTQRETYLAISRIQHEVLTDLAGASDTLRSALLVCHQDATIHLELARCLASTGQHDEAVAEFAQLLDRDPAHVEAWRGMARVYHDVGRKVEAGIALAPLVVLGEATEIEAAMARRRKVAPGESRAGSFESHAFHVLTAAHSWQAEAALCALLNPLSEAFAKVYGGDLQRYKVTVQDRIEERSAHPLRQQCDRLAQAFSLTEYELYVHRSDVADVTVELTYPAAVMVPQYVMDLPAAERVFLLARAFASLARGAHVVTRLGDQEVARAVGAVVRSVDRSASAGWLSRSDAGDDLSQLGKQLRGALSRRNRRTADEAAAAFMAEQGIDVRLWARSAATTSNRVAALLAGDLVAAVEMLRRLTPAISNLTGAALVRGSEAVADLFRFWTTAEALQARHRAGII